MKKERKPRSFLQKPSYPGGTQAMRKFLADHLKYPAAATRENVKGTVRVKMTIDYRGHVTDAKVLVGLGHGCDEEAQRVVKLLRFEVPKLRKVRASFNKTINIHFKNPPKPVKKQQPAPAAPQGLVYTVTKSKPKPEQKKQPNSGGSYTYTISH